MKKIFFYRTLSALFIGGMTFSAISCADELGENTSNDDKEAVVSFNVADAQEEAQTRGALTRGAITPGLTAKDLNGQKLAAQSNENLDVCLIETTVEGVNPVKIEPGTRANITTMANLGNFSSTGLRGTAATAINTDWFSETSTKKDGTFANTRIPWSWLQPHARFYAVYPEKANSNGSIKFNKPTATTAPSIEFTVQPEVTQQVDLMTACSGNVQYAVRGQAPRTDLRFRHALTAIRFAVGQNLSFDKTIKDIKLKNVLLTSKYVLSDKLDGTGAAWNHNGYTKRGDVKLSNVNYNTNENPNSIVRNRSQYVNSNVTDLTQLRDNYTFYMIPQNLDNQVTAEIVFTDNTRISIPLKGKWDAGTTRTYKLSQKNSSWVYTINGTSPSAVAYNATQASYKIESYRQAPDGTKQAVAWKVVGYSVDNGTTWTTTKPSWLKSLSKEQGNGGTEADVCTATLGTDIVDLIAERNKGLQNATPLGTAATPYNLSNETGAAAVQNTANCYVISAPGYYMIPLVYGNAIKNSATNRSAYVSSAPVTKLWFGSPANWTDVVLHNFVDHLSRPITDPWIEKTYGGSYKNIDGAEVTWSDEKDLVTLSGSPIYRDASGNAFVKFEVKKENLKSGNTVISVKKGGTILWSWHLWFAPKNALDKIQVTNKQNKVYEFTNEPLGWKPTLWTGTSYSTPRTVKVKVEQTMANNGDKQVAVITITQNPGLTKKSGTTTLYQWGRNNAFPGSSTRVPEGTIYSSQEAIHMNNKIQKPNYFFTTKILASGAIDKNDALTKYHYIYNLWSMNNHLRGDIDAPNTIEVVKTIYDPCPVGFNVPTNGAFSGFTTSTTNGTNVSATFDLNSGHIFWTNSNHTESIYFPASGYRNAADAVFTGASTSGNYWSADPQDYNNGCVMGFSKTEIKPLFRNIRTYGFAVRPVAEK